MNDKSWISLPEAFVERTKRVVGEDKFEAVIKCFCEKRPTTLRVNTIKTTPEKVSRQIETLGLSYTTVGWYNNAYVINGDPYTTLGSITGSEMYKLGEIYVQNLSSMIPPLVLNPSPGQRVLDLAAAPGSKTTQMAMMMENKGEIMANDLSPIRIFKLRANLEGQGVKNTITMKMPGQFLWKRYPNYFDKVLVDAPCSLEGTIQVDRPKSYAQWSVHKIKELSQRQRYLLRSAITATRPGGEIVYSTCTLAPEENEGVIDWVLSKEKVEIVPIELPGIVKSPAILQWGNAKPYDPRVAETFRILPSETMEGFFVAKLKKLH